MPATSILDSLPPDWASAISHLAGHPLLTDLAEKVAAARAAGEVYPAAENVFAALHMTPLTAVRAVIIGQDPYHGPGQAQGFSFSVPRGMTKPPSLRNIHQELAADLGCQIPSHGDLSSWARNGVLLLNAVLTVGHKAAGSHAGWGWEFMTDEIIKVVAGQQEPAAFILWGAYAQKKAAHVVDNRHLLLMSTHPSPFAARNGFFGSRPFSKVNAWLTARNAAPIDWSIPA